MGYYTSYELTWEPHLEEVEIFLEANSEKYYGVNSDGSGSESVKWYEHEADVLALSKRFPNVLFTLSGDGEESGDIWKKYFKDGKKQICKAKIVVPPFNEKELR